MGDFAPISNVARVCEKLLKGDKPDPDHISVHGIMFRVYVEIA